MAIKLKRFSKWSEVPIAKYSRMIIKVVRELSKSEDYEVKEIKREPRGYNGGLLIIHLDKVLNPDQLRTIEKSIRKAQVDNDTEPIKMHSMLTGKDSETWTKLSFWVE